MILIEKKAEIWTNKNNFLKDASLLKIQDQCTAKKLYMNQNMTLLHDLVFNYSKFNVKNLRNYQVADQETPQSPRLPSTRINAETSLKFIVELIKVSNKEKNV